MKAVGVSVLFMFITAFICILAPTLLAAVMVKKYKANWRALFLGAAAFTVAQPLLRLPLLKWLGYKAWFVLFSQSNTLLFLALLGLSAGIFEELSRFIALRFFLKKRLTWANGVVFGLGHGGAEALLLVGLNYVGLLYNFMSGRPINFLGQTPPYLFLVAGLERVMAISAHIGMTMLVLYAVKTKKLRYLFYAILFHALIDSPVVVLLSQRGQVWASEGYVAVFAAFALWLTVRFRAILAVKEGPV
ncbi:Putative membrane peptidase family (DUF2324) [Acididesulfobacillus acetoxydans]|uniref:Membrane peptidase family (DUF2324) n=1 Tax=Acididesulfobacillus acetoxydans TaxID=1561005 RepID=A0A8S0X6N2_9FIRM|nr:YhfC family glutamic-type intramembrane protease [Acididesulfobacillus acetoxydans]CAA7602690.1 Putative membrane peptidase family (DUF2324) [Acididesulfobacillus acetoxydans]CEJ06453.1 Putative membrane peptidase family (DUF2324) [Acididesulfobacillus acetoxydans]